ncbi:hypothetical protein [Leeuwenhoekiella blandensis]|uniref:Uncharacterized protein n=1 Tax=Leeuwenhoekiella blandensis (strain CECT 7118 / CCUG 51940 / KCTC 22103 / MED217) TaxID=398720 RepID=A3XLH6_LEEBM|nr:hypothetical protein [Leeuwenhoekiella blandensis]EAQ49592.1 hypothetical protein MED217_12074 [Leeuwenhoekiella blandensis MED217]
MSKINLEVRDNYEFLQELSYEEKNLNTNTIVLEPKRNNRDWLKQSSNIDHSTIEENITLIVEKKISFFKYGIKLHCPNFTSQPYFRFDSDGPAHRNKSEPSLPEQKITTPHFNTFDEKGNEFAYKSETLKRDEDAQAIAEDLNFGISHFFKETNIKTNGKEEFPEIKIDEPELFEIELDTDPLNGIDFLD